MLAADVDLGKKISKASVRLLLRHPFSAAFSTVTKCLSPLPSRPPP